MHIIEVSYTSGMSVGEIILVIILGGIAGGIIGFIVHVLFVIIEKVWNWLKRLFD